MGLKARGGKIWAFLGDVSKDPLRLRTWRTLGQGPHLCCFTCLAWCPLAGLSGTVPALPGSPWPPTCHPLPDSLQQGDALSENLAVLLTLLESGSPSAHPCHLPDSVLAPPYFCLFFPFWKGNQLKGPRPSAERMKASVATAAPWLARRYPGLCQARHSLTLPLACTFLPRY